MNPSTKPNDVPRISLRRDESGRLVLIDPTGVRHTGVEVVRAFPLSEPAEWISLCDTDGREIVTIESPAELDAETLATLRTEMTRREFLPVIQRIADIAMKSDPATWVVETDRGPTTFFVEGSDAVRCLDAARCLVVDMQGVRYLIVDRNQLDAPSRKLLEHYL
jgi:hypothetical protein